MIGPVSLSILALGVLVSALELPGKSPAMTLLFEGEILTKLTGIG